jgi:hypothetical protein
MLPSSTWCISIFLNLFLTAIGLTPSGSSTVQYSTVQYSTVQYTFTHKQYTEYRERNIHNNKKKKKKIGKCGRCPVFGSYTLAFALQLGKKHGKTSVTAVEKCPDIPVAVVENTFTHKRYTEQQNETEYTEPNIHNNKNKIFWGKWQRQDVKVY